MAASRPGGAGFTFTNPDKVYFPATERHPAYSKADLARYYDAMADAILPHLYRRPMALRRYPNGIAGASFFQKDFDARTPDAVRKVPLWSAERGEPIQWIVMENPETLLYLVQLGSIEMHPWLSRVGHCDRCRHTDEPPDCGLDHPDLLVLDVDPYVRQGRLGRRPTEAGGEPGISREDYEKAAEVAQLARRVLASFGVRSWVKTSGKRGLHVYVPILPRHSYDEVRAFAQALGVHLASEHPKLVTVEYSKEKRAGRVFFDANQNARGKTLASPWSARPTPEASVSMPLRWEDVRDADPAAFTIETVPELLREKGDPWEDYRPQDLASVVARHAQDGAAAR